MSKKQRIHEKERRQSAAAPKAAPKAPKAADKKPEHPWLKWLSPLTCLVALLAIAVCLLHFEDEYLWKVQELNLHLNTPLFYHQQLVVAGGWLTWMGTWFTEFFYHPVLGVMWLCVCWALLMAFIARAFRVPLKWSALLLIPVALLLLTCVDLGYWIYYLKLRGHFFVATIALCIVCGEVWAYRSLPARHFLRPLFIALATALLYPAIGFYALLGALLMGIMEWRLKAEDKKLKWIASLVAVLAIIVVPLVYYRLVFYQTSETNIWWAALPLFRIVEEHAAYYIPYYILVAFFVIMAATYGRLCDGIVKRPLSWGLIHVALLVVLVMGVKMFWYRDYNFHKELRMQRCMENADWQGILQEAADQQDEPTRAIVMMRNLALFRLGRQGDEMYHYLTGAKESNTPIPVSMTQVVGRSIYFYYGLPNYCYRWCLEDGVEFGWRAEELKYMTRSALVNGEYRVARKYINLLKQTRYHGEWARQQEAFLNNGEAIAADANYRPVLELMKFTNNLNSDQAVVEKFLMQHFVYDRGYTQLYQDEAMNAALWMKDIQLFWPIFNRYAANHKDEHMPIHYQEAAYLYGHLENGVDISHMPFDVSVKQSYEAFMALAQRCKGMTEEKMKEVFFPQFGKTFYYEYFLVRNQKLY
ncbi:MAG: DUF6057 family protein [Prevotella sp.]|nr:DUF6057 family protein [Prevotella sp.]